MTELFHTYLLEISLFVLILIATALTHFFVRNRTFTLIVFGFSCLVYVLVISLSILSGYVGSHVIAELIDGTVTQQSPRTGWGLLLDAWPIWVVPSIFAAVITGLISALILGGENRDYLTVVQQASKQEQTTGPTATSSRLVMKQIEINELERKLQIADEKYRQAKDESKQKPVRLDKYMTELSELRKKTGELEKQARTYKDENIRLMNELSDAQRLIDDLMRS